MMTNTIANSVRRFPILARTAALICAVGLTLLSAGSAHAQAEEAVSSTGCAPGGAFQGLASFGALNEHGYPSRYTDHNGVALELCDETTDIDPFCGNPPFGDPLGEGLPFDAPPDIPSGNFWHEVFYFLGGADMTFTGGDALIVLAVEGVFDNATEDIIDGDQLVFSRIRHRISLPNQPSSVGTYTVTHPFGVDVFEVTQADLDARNGVRAINFTDDCLHGVVDGVITPTCGVALGDQFTNPTDDTRSRISHYLSWDSGAPAGYIGDPATPHTVTGSPCGTNVFRVEGPGIPGGSVETNLFILQGRLIVDTCGDGIIDPTETCDDGNTDDGDCCSSTCQIDDGGTCSDGELCTNDVCSGGICQSSPTDCPDLGACTNEACNPATGACMITPVDCDDGDLCTTDTCDAVTGCANVAVECPDTDACNVGSCNPATGGCDVTPVNCDDGNACTTDTCDAVTGCANTPIPGCGVETLILLSTSPDRSAAVPLDGATVSGDIFVFTDTDATDRDVRFWLDDPERLGSPIKVERKWPHDLNGTADDGTASPFDTTALSDGTHIITVRVRDADGLSTFAHASFVVNNGGGPGPDPVVLDLVWTRNPDRSLPMGLDGATVSDSIFAYLTALNATVETVEFFLDDVAMAAPPARVDTEAPYDLVGGDALTADPLATTDLSDGTHTLTARVTLAGADIRTLTATFEVLNAAPAAPIIRVSKESDRDPSDPLDGATVGGDIYVFVAPEDGIINLAFWIDDPLRSGAPARRENKAPFDLAGGSAASANPFDTTTLSDGSHTITVRAKMTDGTKPVFHATFTVDQLAPVAVRWPGGSIR